MDGGDPLYLCNSTPRAVDAARDAGLRVLHGRALTALAVARMAERAVDAAVTCCDEALAIHAPPATASARPARWRCSEVHAGTDRAGAYLRQAAELETGIGPR